MMVIAYPVSVLVALYVTTTAAVPPSAHLRKFLQNAAVITAAAIGVIGIVCAALALKLLPSDLALTRERTCLLALAAIVLAILLIRLTLRTPLAQAPLAAAASLAILMSIGWGITNSLFRPLKAPTDASRIVHMQINAAIPRDLPIFTTRTLLSGKGNSYFNIQFYLPSIPRAINDIAELPRNKRIVLIIGWSEWPDLMKVLPTPDKFTILRAENGPPHLYALELTLPDSPATASVPSTTNQSTTPARPASSP
jgi:hypothetical protein